MSLAFFTEAKKLTHLLASGIALLATFSMTDAGQALIRQYPHLAALATLVGALGALYRAPGNKQ